MAAGIAKTTVWNKMVEDNREKWQYYINLYTYSTQVPANSFYTSRLYPAFYQERLMKKKLYENMQMLGEVTKSELKEYDQLINDPHFAKTYGYYFGSRFSKLGNFSGLAGWIGISTACFVNNKPPSWLVFPGLIFYMLTLGIKLKFYRLGIGKVIDMTEWVKEKRKAEIWLEKSETTFTGMPPLPQAKKQIYELITSLK